MVLIQPVLTMATQSYNLKKVMCILMRFKREHLFLAQSLLTEIQHRLIVFEMDPWVGYLIQTISSMKLAALETIGILECMNVSN